MAKKRKVHQAGQRQGKGDCGHQRSVYSNRVCCIKVSNRQRTGNACPRMGFESWRKAV